MSPATNSTPSNCRLLAPRQAAERLAISPRKLWSMTASGEVRSVRIGRAVRYDVADLDAFVEASKK